MAKDLIIEIIGLRNNKKRLEKFMENFDILKEWSMIIFNDNKKKNTIPDYLKTKIISKNFFNYSPYPSSDFLVFNADSVQAISDRASYQYRISGAIELDTNILSYLSSFIEIGNDEFKEIFDYENYALNNKVKSYLDEESLKREVDITMRYIDIGESYISLINRNKFDLIYCELLLMIVVEYSYPKKSLAFKLGEFISECARKLGSIPSREVTIAKNYFLNELSFFDPIQKNNKNIFKKLESMSWDLLHIHFTENAMLFANVSDCDLYFPSFLTRDKKLFDALKEYVLDSYAYNSVTKEFISFCDIKKIVFPNKNIKLTKTELKNI